MKIRQTKNYIQIQEKLNNGKSEAQKEKDDGETCCVDLIALKDDLEQLRKILKEEELVNQQLEQVQQRLDNYYGLPGHGGNNDEKEFEEKVYSNMIDESTKILVTSQQRYVPDPKKAKAGGLEESGLEEK